MKLTRRDTLAISGLATGMGLAGCLSFDEETDRLDRYTPVGSGGTTTQTSSLGILGVTDVEGDDGTLHVEFSVRNDGTAQETGLVTITATTASGTEEREYAVTLGPGEQVTRILEFGVPYEEFRSLQIDVTRAE